MYKKYLYLFALQVPLITTVTMLYDDWRVFLPILEIFILLPIVDLIVPASSMNYSKTEEKDKLAESYFDFLLYAVSFLWFLSWFYFIWSSSQLDSWWLLILKSINVGIGCGVVGINVAHELGHRNKGYEQFLAKCLLATSLYMHFIIEHNKGHHKHVATPNDPASAIKGESVYRFLPRTIFGSFQSAWKMELSKKWYDNNMFRYMTFQFLLVTLVLFIFGIKSFVGVLVAALVGIFLLEVVNYIEHYGLSRKFINGKYEKVAPWHSWNSDHWVGRVFLFELSRHSDHHFLANRKYQVLRSLEDTPQLPTGYPGMIVLSLFPWLWYRVMHPRLEQVSRQYSI